MSKAAVKGEAKAKGKGGKLEGLLCRVRSITAMSLPRRSRSRTPPERPRPTSASKGNGGDSGGGAKGDPDGGKDGAQGDPEGGKGGSKSSDSSSSKGKGGKAAGGKGLVEMRRHAEAMSKAAVKSKLEGLLGRVRSMQLDLTEIITEIDIFEMMIE